MGLAKKQTELSAQIGYRDLQGEGGGLDDFHMFYDCWSSSELELEEGSGEFDQFKILSKDESHRALDLNVGKGSSSNFVEYRA
mmetsp:Transcript_25594/g.39372  ORF Transcript_25594/g.39372 Transcript_25594/m.39372 type:complete len:83 (+) Transcript_25594:216-464(+)|eukprot:CAMPEP_0170491650 /NCGR_PEP_ID=MMETSP0208-20121228/11174_1 /TAXON_ID=197538 /ORGANISM="Strombidium inclinatum, Strain S3" /LENGTH=82 /DNA_ID=CAMNT_0010767261 /DNA_START=216 /DNA_END=464 /DNA_ORIENTATION=+